MTIRHLRIFVAVCACGSITEGAARLYMTQPAVSLAVKELEACYGVRLFDRLARHIQLTEDGRRLLDYATHVVALFDEMEQAIKNPDAAGTLKIGSSLTIGTCLLPAYMKELSRQCPHLQPLVTVDNTDRILHGVRAGLLDVALVEGAVTDPALVALAFMSDRLVAVCAADHPYAKGAPVSLGEFLAQPLLLRERGSGTRELFQSAVTLLGWEPKPTWESVSTTALINGVMAGVGVSVLPERLVASYLDGGRLGRVQLQHISLRRNFYLIYHKNKYLSAGLRAFLNLVMRPQPARE